MIKKILFLAVISPLTLLQAMDLRRAWPTTPGKAIARPVWELEGSLALSRRAYDLYGNSFGYVETGEDLYKQSLRSGLKMGANHECCFSLVRLQTEEITSLKIELDYLASDIALAEKVDFEGFFLKSSEPVESYRLQFEKKDNDIESVNEKVRQLVRWRYEFVKKLADNGGLQRIEEVRKMIWDQALFEREPQKKSPAQVNPEKAPPARVEAAGLAYAHASAFQSENMSSKRHARDGSLEKGSVKSDGEFDRRSNEPEKQGAETSGSGGHWFSYKRATVIVLVLGAAILGKKYLSQKDEIKK